MSILSFSRSKTARQSADEAPHLRIRLVTARAMPEIGGIETHVAEVATRLAERGHEVDVVTTDRTGSLLRVERVPTSIPGATYVVRRHRAFPRNRDWYFSPGLFLSVLRTRVDVVHVQGVHTLVPPLAMLAAILRRLPFVLSFHTGGSSSSFRATARGAQWRILTPLLRRADSLVAVSEYEAQMFRKVLGPAYPVRVIRNGGGLPDDDLDVAVDADLVVSAGRLERYKGHHRVIEALPHLLRTRPGATVQILGSGPYETDLLALAQRLGVADRVSIRYVAPLERGAMARALGAAGAVALLSDYEAHPVAVMEALSLGRPVLVARTSGLTELADAGWVRGVAVDADPATIAAALDEQLTSPVCVDPDTLPTWSTCVQQLDDVYLLARASSNDGGAGTDASAQGATVAS